MLIGLVCQYLFPVWRFGSISESVSTARVMCGALVVMIVVASRPLCEVPVAISVVAMLPVWDLNCYDHCHNAGLCDLPLPIMVAFSARLFHSFYCKISHYLYYK